MDPSIHHETPGSGAQDPSHMVMVAEARGIEAFELERRVPVNDGYRRDVFVMDDEWPVNPGVEGALRQSQEELRQLSVKLLTVQESERQRIAADLHDGIGQSLSLIKLSLEQAAQLMLAGKDQVAAEVVQQTIHKVQDAMTELRRTTCDLRPPMLDDLGIIPTMRWFFREFESVCAGLKIVAELEISESDVPVQLKATIFRILQEALNNIIKHAKANSVRVALKITGAQLQFSVEDNGQGFDRAGLPDCRSAQRRFGLLTMKERARSSDGIFEIRTSCGLGTMIQITWRLKGEAGGQCEPPLPGIGKP